MEIITNKLSTEQVNSALCYPASVWMEP